MSCHQSLHLSFSSSARKPRSYSLFRFSAVGWGHTVAKISGWNAMWTCPRVRTIYNYIWCKAGYGGFSQVEKNLKTASNLVLFDQFPPCFNLFQAFFFSFCFMAGGGGGFGGFGGLGGGFGCGNFQSHHPVYRPSPPLTAIDRFLVGQSHFSQRQTQNSERNSGDVVSSNGFHDFYSASGAIGSIGSGGSWQFLEEDGLNLKEKKSSEVVQSGEEKVAKRSSRASGKRAKGGSSATLIKGQWSAEEDRWYENSSFSRWNVLLFHALTSFRVHSTEVI